VALLPRESVSSAATARSARPARSRA
jgi:hypothetical protein